MPSCSRSRASRGSDAPTASIEILPASLVAPAPGQGSLAVQVRADDTEAIEAVVRLDDPATRTAVQAERAVLNGTGGGCRSPIGALGRLDGDTLEVVAAAERSWVPRPDAPFAPTIARIAWIRGRSPAAEHRALAARLARRVVTLRERPRVLTLRPDAQAGASLDALEAAGVDAANVPAIEIVPTPAGTLLDLALSQAQAGQRVVVTSANGADAVVAALGRLDLPAGRFAWAAVGEASRSVLAAAGADDAFVPTDPDGASLAAELPVQAGPARPAGARRARRSGAPGDAPRTWSDGHRGRRVPDGRRPDVVDRPPRRGAGRRPGRRPRRHQRVDRPWPARARGGRRGSCPAPCDAGRRDRGAVRGRGARRGVRHRRDRPVARPRVGRRLRRRRAGRRDP